MLALSLFQSAINRCSSQKGSHDDFVRDSKYHAATWTHNLDDPVWKKLRTFIIGKLQINLFEDIDHNFEALITSTDREPVRFENPSSNIECLNYIAEIYEEILKEKTPHSASWPCRSRMK